MIQDIAPHRLDNTYSYGRMPVDGDVVFHFCRRQVLVRDTDQDSFLPLWAQLKDCLAAQELIFLFRLDDVACYLTLNDTPFEQAGLCYVAERALRHGEKPRRDEEMFALFTAMHLDHWYRSNRFCGCCGGKMVPGQKERRLDCPACGAVVYPRINPAVIIGVIHGEQLLITRYAASRGVSVDALVAGFCEIGETLEDTVHREVMEEVGLKVKNLRYYKSQPWGLADDLLAGFYCEVDGDPGIHVDEEELSRALWVNRAEIVGQPNPYSLTNEMMLTFRDGKEPKLIQT